MLGPRGAIGGQREGDACFRERAQALGVSAAFRVRQEDPAQTCCTDRALARTRVSAGRRTCRRREICTRQQPAGLFFSCWHPTVPQTSGHLCGETPGTSAGEMACCQGRTVTLSHGLSIASSAFPSSRHCRPQLGSAD